MRCFVFYNVQLNQVDVMMKRSELGAPSRQTAIFLLEMLKDKLREYDIFFLSNGIEVQSSR